MKLKNDRPGREGCVGLMRKLSQLGVTVLAKPRGAKTK